MSDLRITPLPVPDCANVLELLAENARRISAAFELPEEQSGTNRRTVRRKTVAPHPAGEA